MQIAILAAGEMGAGVGAQLVGAGHSVSTVLEGRGQETIERATDAGFDDRQDLPALLGDADIVLSILPPAAAHAVAEDIAAVARDAGLHSVFFECNAVSPMHVQEIAGLFENTACPFIDGGIVGGPPRSDYRPHLYVSGADFEAMDESLSAAFDVRRLGSDIGTASAMKMCYAAITTGLNSLLTTALLAAGRYELLDELSAELAESQPDLLARAEKYISRLPSDAERWAPEMRFIAETFEAVGVPPEFHLGAAEILEILANSPFGSETRRSRDLDRTALETIRKLV